MVALVKFQEVSRKFLEVLRDGERDLCVVKSGLYTYDIGAWAAVNEFEQDRLDRTLREVCDDENFPYAEKYAAIWRYIKSTLPIVDYDTLDAKGWIALPNGTLDPTTGDLYEHNPEHHITRRAAIEYDPEARCPEWLAMLDRMVEDKPPEAAAEYKDFLQCWFGLALVGFRNHNGREFRKLLMLHGPKRTAKSTLADVARHLIGKGYIVADNVEQICSRFGLESVHRSVAIIADDAIGAKSKVDAERLKCLITGDPVSADRKNKTMAQFEYYGPIMFTTNNLPRVSDASDALYERTVVLNFTRTFTKKDIKEQLGGKRNVVDFIETKGEWSGILNWALEGLARAVEDDGLPQIKSARNAGEEWRSENDPIFAFMSEHTAYDEDVSNFPLPVAAAISIYAETQMGDRSYPTKRVSTILGRQIESLVPGVKKGRRQLWKEQNRCYEGLKLLEGGQRLVQAARERGLLPQDYPINAKNL